MPYKIKIAKQVEESILSWDLPPGVIEQLRQKLLLDLQTQAEAMLGEVVVPFANFRACHITIESRSEYPHRFWFVFVIDCGTPGELHILSGRLTEDTERN